MRTILIFTCLIGIPATAHATDDTVAVVLDFSNSMWGQVDEVAKIEIARDVFADMLRDWDPSRQLGVVAYGHRSTDDCADIEVIQPVGPVDAAALTAQIAELKPTGKTPLTEAVRQAAELLRYRDEPATVVLLSDGIETCNADPCAVAQELERSGIKFTAHVIGFDVGEDEQAQLMCIAEATGGSYYTAADATGLAEALTAATTVEEPTTITITLRAVDAETGELLSGPIEWILVAMGDSAAPLLSGDGSEITLALESGDFIIQAIKGSAQGEVNFTVSADAASSVDVPLASDIPEATVEAPAEIPAGSQFDVSWTGPGESRDYITIVEAGAPEGSYLNYERINRGNPLKLTAPDSIGQFEVRYVWHEGDITLATQAVTLVPVEGSVEAPAEIQAGSQFEVSWTGPDNNTDYITIVEAGAPEGSYQDYERTNRGSPLTLTAPDGLGQFEVRYVIGQSSRTLASQTVTLVATEATVEAPLNIPSGSQFEVTWTGPDNNRDYITIVEAGADEGSYLDYERTNRGSPMTLTAPDGLGAYEVRYVLGESGRTLTSLAVTLVDVEASISAPAEVPSGGPVEITWSGPDNDRDYIAIAEAGAPDGTYVTYQRTNRGSPLTLEAPDALGNYEVRYVLGQSGRTIASQAIILVPVEATLKPLNSIVPGGELQIAWTGPGYNRDYIAVTEAGAPEGHYLEYKRVTQGNPVTLKLPESLGNFELRYVIGQSGRTLTSLPITIAPATVTLSAPANVAANGTLEVAWTGPGNWEDFIEIVPAGSPDDATPTREARTSQGNPLPMFAPAQAGDYEIRYIMRDTGEVVAKIGLIVE